MFPETAEEDDETPSVPESCFKGSVGLKNDSEVFLFYGSEQLVVAMAKNFLGTHHAIKECVLVDIFREAANVITGNLVTTLAPDGSVCFGIPVVERVRICTEPETAPGAVFTIDDEFFKFAVMNS